MSLLSVGRSIEGEWAFLISTTIQFSVGGRTVVQRSASRPGSSGPCTGSPVSRTQWLWGNKWAYRICIMCVFSRNWYSDKLWQSGPGDRPPSRRAGFVRVATYRPGTEKASTIKKHLWIYVSISELRTVRINNLIACHLEYVSWATLLLLRVGAGCSSVRFDGTAARRGTLSEYLNGIIFTRRTSIRTSRSAWTRRRPRRGIRQIRPRFADRVPGGDSGSGVVWQLLSRWRK